MIHQLIYIYAESILLKLRSSEGQSKEAESFHQKIGICLQQSWDNPTAVNAQMLEIVNSQLPTQSQLSLLVDQLRAQTPIQSPQSPQTRDNTPDESSP